MTSFFATTFGNVKARKRHFNHSSHQLFTVSRPRDCVSFFNVIVSSYLTAVLYIQTWMVLESPMSQHKRERVLGSRSAPWVRLQRLQFRVPGYNPYMVSLSFDEDKHCFKKPLVLNPVLVSPSQSIWKDMCPSAYLLYKHYNIKQHSKKERNYKTKPVLLFSMYV